MTRSGNIKKVNNTVTVAAMLTVYLGNVVSCIHLTDSTVVLMCGFSVFATGLVE